MRTTDCTTYSDTHEAPSRISLTKSGHRAVSVEQIQILVVFIATAVMATLVVGSLVIASRRAPARATFNDCNSNDCRFHAKLLGRSRESGVPLCANFYSHVCGNWYPTRYVGRGALDDPYSHDAELSFINLETSKAKQTLPGSMFQKCFHETPLDREALPLLRSLMVELGLFTYNASTIRDPLDILLEMVLKRGMTFWYDIRLLKPKDTPRVILFHHHRLVEDWHQRMELCNDEQHFIKVVQQYLSIIGPFLNVSVTGLLEDAKVILRSLLNITWAEPFEGISSLDLIQRWTPHIPGHLWLHLLNAHYAPYHVVRTTSTVLAEDVRLLRVLDNLLHTIPSHRIVSVLAWHFVQEHGWMAAPEVEQLRFGTDRNREWRKKMACLKYTRQVYGLFTDVNRDRFVYKPNERRKIDYILRSLNRKMVEMVDGFRWIDDSSKEAISAKLADMKVELWPADIFFNYTSLQHLYSNFPMTSDSFLESFLNATEIRRSLVNHVHADDVYNRDITSPFGLFGYSHYLNTVMVSISALNYPLYYPHGTAAMNYGGLGFQYAKEIVKVLDHVVWWSKSAASNYKIRTSCTVRGIDGTRVRNRFLLLLALDIAFWTFGAEIEDAYITSADSRQYGTQETFFMTYCYSMCSSSRREMDECNYPLMNSYQFQRAFTCPDNTYMNPEQKCEVF
ncbi:endothelin-converting enzyme 1-like [Ornithodoros turicata]|uniref:endothelin-converting enzyme 1-like n=1 Tax=Ornithodoros turicata TaxID=34597 RepID=UPI003139E6C9